MNKRDRKLSFRSHSNPQRILSRSPRGSCASCNHPWRTIRTCSTVLYIHYIQVYDSCFSTVHSCVLFESFTETHCRCLLQWFVSDLQYSISQVTVYLHKSYKMLKFDHFCFRRFREPRVNTASCRRALGMHRTTPSSPGILWNCIVCSQSRAAT